MTPADARTLLEALTPLVATITGFLGTALAYRILTRKR